jgi:hypothetical protein
MIDHKSLSRVLFGSRTPFCGPLAATSDSGRKLTATVLQIQGGNVDVVNIGHRGGSNSGSCVRVGRQTGRTHRITRANKGSPSFFEPTIRVIDEVPMNDNEPRHHAWNQPRRKRPADLCVQ